MGLSGISFEFRRSLADLPEKLGHQRRVKERDLPYYSIRGGPSRLAPVSTRLVRGRVSFFKAEKLMI